MRYFSAERNLLFHLSTAAQVEATSVLSHDEFETALQQSERFIAQLFSASHEIELLDTEPVRTELIGKATAAVENLSRAVARLRKVQLNREAALLQEEDNQAAFDIAAKGADPAVAEEYRAKLKPLRARVRELTETTGEQLETERERTIGLLRSLESVRESLKKSLVASGAIRG